MREDARGFFCAVAAPYDARVSTLDSAETGECSGSSHPLDGIVFRIEFHSKFQSNGPRVFQGRLPAKLLSVWQCVGYQSIARETLYNFGFGGGTVGVVLGAQTQV